MKVMAGLVEPDHGSRVVPPGMSVGYMEQDPDMAGFATLGDFASSALDSSEMYKVEMAGEGLKFDPARAVETASGVERRRAALAKLSKTMPTMKIFSNRYGSLRHVFILLKVMKIRRCVLLRIIFRQGQALILKTT